ncbi:MAG: hypothetical protein ACE362_02730 [Phaeodactylibacter xiamenensis]|uniref:hypothetical protein n=1 Tax=Phaeodactylibacter xiamenensis TaxID=1524460 RepID=UPI0013625441|nr:hypothetical protein [Phaeodactylibacter xiamenensis]MCR9053908.1 hypothetical protein [bacterium]
MLAIKNMLNFGFLRQDNPSLDFWDELSDEQKNQIKKSIQFLEAGEAVPHNTAM